MNFTPVYKGALGGNCALFGWIGESGVVRNLNVLNASIEGRISGGIVNTNYGLVENCFVSTVVNYQPATGDTNNPIGAVCSKNYGDIRNTIAVLTLGEVVTDSSRIGGFVGRHLGGSSSSRRFEHDELLFAHGAWIYRGSEADQRRHERHAHGLRNVRGRRGILCRRYGRRSIRV